MKPRLVRVKGWWRCGLVTQTFLYWSQADTPEAAFELWKRGSSLAWRFE